MVARDFSAVYLKGAIATAAETSSRICMRQTTFATPVYQCFTPFSIFTLSLSKISPFAHVYPSLSAFNPVYPCLSQFIHAAAPCLATFMPFYPRVTLLPCFTQFIHFLSRSRMFYPVCPCLPPVIHALLGLLMFTYVCP